MLTRRSLIAPSALTGLAILPAYAAEVYPARTVKIVVPFPPGTPSEFRDPGACGYRLIRPVHFIIERNSRLHSGECCPRL